MEDTLIFLWFEREIVMDTHYTVNYTSSLDTPWILTIYSATHMDHIDIQI